MPSTVKLNTKGADALLAQKCLRNAGYYKYQLDGWFGPESVKSLKTFQKKKGHTPDGVCGPKTWPDLLKFKPKEPTPAPTPPMTMVKVLDLNYVEQPDMVTCGCVTGNRMLKSLGIPSKIERLRVLMKTQPITAGSPGTTPDNFKAGLIAAAGEQGKTLNFTATFNLNIYAVKSYIDQGVALGLHGGTTPCMDYEKYYGHYITVIGYNLDTSQVYIHDSSRGKKWIPWSCLQSFIARRNAANPWKIATL